MLQTAEAVAYNISFASVKDSCFSNVFYIFVRALFAVAKADLACLLCLILGSGGLLSISVSFTIYSILKMSSCIANIFSTSFCVVFFWFDRFRILLIRYYPFCCNILLMILFYSICLFGYFILNHLYFNICRPSLFDNFALFL